MMELPDGWKSFKIGLMFWYNTVYWRVTDTQPASHVAIAYTTVYAMATWLAGYVTRREGKNCES